MTRLLRTRAELRAALADAPRPVGLVPTMGWLHEGHRALIRKARASDATTVVSIFVNPRQFNDDSDFTRYPRNEARDVQMCVDEVVDFVWAPPADEVFVPGFDTTVSLGEVARPLEGAARPGHFDGVATVVAVLFGVVGAEHAYFGQKDAQQVMVVRRMATDLGLPTEVIAFPTVREPDGLAMSSRNAHLSPVERAAAPVVHRALLAARTCWEESERSGDALRAEMLRVLSTEPLAVVEYVSCADALTLGELEKVTGPALLSMAVRFGSTRLIDNEPLGWSDTGSS